MKLTGIITAMAQVAGPNMCLAVTASWNRCAWYLVHATFRQCGYAAWRTAAREPGIMTNTKIKSRNLSVKPRNPILYLLQYSRLGLGVNWMGSPESECQGSRVGRMRAASPSGDGPCSVPYQPLSVTETELSALSWDFGHYKNARTAGIVFDCPYRYNFGAILILPWNTLTYYRDMYPQ